MMTVGVRLPCFRLAAALRHTLGPDVSAFLIDRSRRRVVEASDGAALAGVRPGMSLREATRVLPRAAVVLEDAARAERSWRRVLDVLARLPAAVDDGGPGICVVRDSARRPAGAVVRAGARPPRAAGPARPLRRGREPLRRLRCDAPRGRRGLSGGPRGGVRRRRAAGAAVHRRRDRVAAAPARNTNRRPARGAAAVVPAAVRRRRAALAPARARARGGGRRTVNRGARRGGRTNRS